MSLTLISSRLSGLETKKYRDLKNRSLFLPHLAVLSWAVQGSALTWLCIWELWFLPYCCFANMRTFSWKDISPISSSSDPKWPSSILPTLYWWEFSDFRHAWPHLVERESGNESSVEQPWITLQFYYSPTTPHLQVLKNQKFFLKFGPTSYGDKIWLEITWGIYRRIYRD